MKDTSFHIPKTLEITETTETDRKYREKYVPKHTKKCKISRNVWLKLIETIWNAMMLPYRLNFIELCTWSASAIIPAARGAAAEVPAIINSFVKYFTRT